MNKIPFTVPYFGKPEIDSVSDLLSTPEKILSESYSKEVRRMLETYYRKNVLITHSCTGALEMCAVLLNIKSGDEVILPSYTFVSTANAFALFGAKPVFIDCQKNNLNIDPHQIEAAITSRTKAIVVMHYAAIACEMDAILKTATKYNLPVIEDAAQCIGASYNDQHLGTFGTMSTLSFHNTKNITSGLGGALIINDESFVKRAKVIWQKGTNREAFIEGMVDKYTWQDLGSSYVLNEFSAAILFGQLQRLDEITSKRINLWNRYHKALEKVTEKYNFERPIIPQGCKHNAHIYYLLAPNESKAIQLRHFLAAAEISAPSHYVPLHLSPSGQKYNENKILPNCENLYKRIVRLPLWEEMEKHFDFIMETLNRSLEKLSE